jgi:hypothetical protein
LSSRRLYAAIKWDALIVAAPGDTGSAMSRENAEVVRRWFETLNARPGDILENETLEAASLRDQARRPSR